MNRMGNFGPNYLLSSVEGTHAPYITTICLAALYYVYDFLSVIYKKSSRDLWSPFLPTLLASFETGLILGTRSKLVDEGLASIQIVRRRRPRAALNEATFS